MFPERLKLLRAEAGLTQKELASKLNIKQQTYAQWENGRTKPRAATLEKFAIFFNVSTDYLLGNTDVRNANIIDDKKLDDAISRSLGFNGKPPTDEERENMKEVLKIYLESLNQVDEKAKGIK
ncbi:helix-turn-helix domain-containing protein [Streptococcus hyointestinalis]|uniref:helix-turn-helix domain-containing protein n=1 Tax=Streptococcus hyointestinalis TaxID=1337 RepID=UPI0013DFD64D|nr:helix-turn-helix transcriptional regulator [Streptococcus hyointestinalis]